MAQALSNLWDLIDANPRIDAAALARAVEDAASTAHDYRTRLLIRDSVLAIQSHWGEKDARDWLDKSPQGPLIAEICESISREAETDEHGFPSLKRRIVDAIQPTTVLQYLRDLSTGLNRPTRLVIGGSISLILSGHLLRTTDYIDVVDEVPENLRTQYQLLAELENEYGMKLAHFQSHYLPSGWENRLHSVGTFGHLQVLIVDGYDVFLTKLFSIRRKDREDLRAILPRLDRSIIEDRLKQTTAAFQTEAKLLDAAKTNWYVLFGENLPA